MNYFIITIHFISKAICRYIYSKHLFNFLSAYIALKLIFFRLEAIIAHVAVKTFEVDNVSRLFVAADTFIWVYLHLRDFFSWNSYKWWTVFKLVVHILLSAIFFHFVHCLLIIIFMNQLCPARKHHRRVCNHSHVRNNFAESGDLRRNNIRF